MEIETKIFMDELTIFLAKTNQKNPAKLDLCCFKIFSLYFSHILFYYQYFMTKAWHCLFFFSFLVFCPIRAAQAAYGGSQARGLIGAIATWDPSCVWDLHHSSQQCRILIPLSEARDRTGNLMVPSQIHFCWAMMGTLVTLSYLHPDPKLGQPKWLPFHWNKQKVFWVAYTTT